MSSANIHALAGAYVLDALPADEERLFEAHFGACPECRAEVAELRATVERLATAAAEPAPSELGASLLEQIEHTPQERVSRLPRPRHGLSRPWLTAAAAAAAAAFVVLSLVAVRLDRRADALERQLAQNTATLSATSRVLSAEPLRTFVLDGDSPRGRLQLADSGHALFSAENLDPAPAGRAYQLWVFDRRGPHSAGTLDVRAGNRVLHPLTLDPARVSAVAVTEEPTGGSSAPTTDPLLYRRIPEPA